MPLDVLIIIGNALLLVIAFILALVMLRSGAMHMYNTGDNVIQNRMKWIILRCIVGLIVIGLIASIGNLVVLILR